MSLPTPSKILVAGIGNIFLGDDAFGSEVAQRLLRREPAFPDNVRIVDFGIRGVDLTYALLDGGPDDVAILIDAVPRQIDPPGTLYLLEPRISGADGAASPHSPVLEAHSMNPIRVLRAVAAMSGGPGRVFVVGCEPSPPLDAQSGYDEEMQMGMSDAVLAAVDPAVAMVEDLINRLLAGELVGESLSSQLPSASAFTAVAAPLET